MSEQAHTQSVLQQFVDRAGSLYSLPAVAMDVVELTSQPKVDLQALKQCVERDPALTVKLLRVVNSSMFGLSREVSDLNQALALLGVKPLKLLVLGFSLPKALFSEVEADTLQRYWRFTLVKAVAARQLAEMFWKSSGDEAFIAGLLQEIGILVLIRELSDSYTSFLKRVVEQQGNLIALETETLGFDHAILSARLLEQWKLPTAIVHAVSQPHEMQHLATLPPEQQTLPQILHLATLIAVIIVDERQDAMNELLTAADRYRRITVHQLDDLLDQLQEQVEIMAEIFAVRVDNAQQYRDIVTQAHQQLATAVAEALPGLIGGPAAVAEEQQALSNDLRRYCADPTEQSSANASTQSARDTTTCAVISPMEPAPARHSKAGADPDPGLVGRLMTAIAACRLDRAEVSLLLLEIDDYDQLLVLHGPERVFQTVRSIKQAVLALGGQSCECVLATDARYAVLLPDCDRRQAVHLGKKLVETLPAWSVGHAGLATPIQCSAAVATLSTPGRGFTPHEFLEAAERCLFAAQASGGGIVKSIDIF